MRKNKHFVTFVCLLVGAALLCSAAVVNIGNAGGYEAYKDGLLGLLKMESYDGGGYLELELDGAQLLRADYVEKLNKNAAAGEAASYQSYSASSDLLPLDEGYRGAESWSVLNPDADEDDHSSRYVSYSYEPGEDSWMIDTSGSVGAIFSSLSEDLDLEDETNAKVMRLIELVCDALVGDLKNNFIYLGSEDGLKSYRISLSGDQLPEIVQAAISLLFDNKLWFGSSGCTVMDAVGFDPYSPDEDGYLTSSDEYREAYRKAWDLIDDEHGGVGAAVIYPDLSIEWFPSPTDYYRTLGELPIAEIGSSSMSEILFLLDGEPEISALCCDLSIDDEGRLMANTISGTAEFKTVDGKWHELKATLSGEFASRDEDVSISLPEVDPNAAYICDQSRATEENGWEYYISQYGVKQTYRQMAVPAEGENLRDFNDFVNLSPIEQFISVWDVQLTVTDAAGLSDEDIDANYYRIGDDLLVEKEEFESMCLDIFRNDYMIINKADEFGVAPSAVFEELLSSYTAITGEGYEGAHAYFSSVPGGETVSAFDIIYDAAGYVGVPLEFYDIGEMLELIENGQLYAASPAVEAVAVSVGSPTGEPISVEVERYTEGNKYLAAKSDYAASDALLVEYDELYNAYSALLSAENETFVDEYAGTLGLVYDELVEQLVECFGSVVSNSSYTAENCGLIEMFGEEIFYNVYQ